MAVYNINGNESNAYSLNGMQLQSAYDISGNNILSYSINNVVSYFRDRTLEVAEEINQLSDDWQNFVFTTDTHGSGNKQHSQAIGLYLLANTPVSMIVLGGDYSYGNWDKEQYTNYMRPYVESSLISKIYALFGNHETKGAGATAEAKACIYNDFLKDKEGIIGDLPNNYYYLDNVDKKTRFMFLNTSDGTSQYNTSINQIEWISQNVILPSSDWSLVVFGHVTLNDMGGITYSNEKNGSSVINAIKNCNGSVVGYICGHQHVDILYHDGDIQHVTLICDKFENMNYYDGVSVTDRVAGTASEQAVTVISVNVLTKQVVLRRIGAGRFQTTNYTYS